MFEEDEGHGVASAVGVECGGEALGGVYVPGEAWVGVSVPVAYPVGFRGGNLLWFIFVEDAEDGVMCEGLEVG